VLFVLFLIMFLISAITGSVRGRNVV
jgi:uncharacterized membrane protein YtjA (UPF0391 family)